MNIPRVFAPTPLFLLPTKTKGVCSKERLLYPFFDQPGIGTPLFPKGRSCLAFVLSLFKSIRPGRNEVIIPAYNAQSLAFAAIFNGLKIRLIDIEENTFFPSYEAYKSAINDKTLAVILPYNWGIFPEIAEIKKMHQLFLDSNVLWIDDLATSIPTGEYANYFNNNSPCLFFSFGKTKITTIMDGGYAFFSQNHPFFVSIGPALTQAISDIESKGQPYSLNIRRLFTNFTYHIYTSRRGFSLLNLLKLAQKDRMPTTEQIPYFVLSHGWEQALKNILDEYFESNMDARLRVAQAYYRYDEQFSDSSCFLFPTTKNQIGSRFPILFSNKEDRNEAQLRFLKNNIGVSTGHQTWLGAVDLLKPYLSEYSESQFLKSISFQDRLLTLPLHSKVTENDVKVIVGIASNCVNT